MTTKFAAGVLGAALVAAGSLMAAAPAEAAVVVKSTSAQSNGGPARPARPGVPRTPVPVPTRC